MKGRRMYPRIYDLGLHLFAEVVLKFSNLNLSIIIYRWGSITLGCRADSDYPTFFKTPLFHHVINTIGLLQYVGIAQFK